MTKEAEITRLRSQIDAPSAEDASLGQSGFRGSKAEALLAFEYDRIPNAMKTPRAIALQRRVATVVIILVPILLVAVAVIGGFNAYRDHQQSVEMQKRLSDLGDTIDRDVRQSLPH